MIYRKQLFLFSKLNHQFTRHLSQCLDLRSEPKTTPGSAKEPSIYQYLNSLLVGIETLYDANKYSVYNN